MCAVKRKGNKKGNKMAKNARKKTREEILDLSIPLFAASGYDGVSIREIAGAVGVTPSALYYHFPDKEQLYLEVVAYAFKEKVALLKAVLEGKGEAPERLNAFIFQFARMLATEKDFHRLLQWVLLDGGGQRLHKLVDNVFQEWFVAVRDLARKLDSTLDPHLLAISIIGLLAFPFETKLARRFLPDYRPQYEKPDVIAQHAVDLLRNGLLGRGPGGGGS